MIKPFFLLIISFVCSLAYAQEVNFSSYKNIRSEEFREFVDLFPDENLPVNSDDIRSSKYIDLSISDLPSEFVNKFLKDSNTFLVSKLYTNIIETGEKFDKYGHFKPMFKLPTNGDYILLAIYQFDGRSEITNKVLLLSYDLNGNFIEAIGNGYLIFGMENEVKCSSNKELQISHTYLPDIGKSYDERWACKPCETASKTDVYQINVNGKSTLISSNMNEPANYRYNGMYFKLVE